MPKWLARWVSAGLFVMVLVSYAATVAHAETPTSANYRFDESALEAGGLIQSSSNNYKTDSSAGSLGVGNSASTNFQVDSGTKTTNDPALTFAVNTSGANFGNFSATSAATTTATFTVLNYTSFGYIVNVLGNAPTNGAHTIDAMATNDSSQPGTEQFGINLVANTSPASFGANPVQGLFGVGTAAANYDTANQFRYVSGEMIASAPKSSGVTTYTISYIVNVGGLTPGGQYTSDQTLVVTGTY